MTSILSHANYIKFLGYGMDTVSEDSGYYFEVYRDARNRFRWRFWAPEGRLMAESTEAYDDRAACLCAIDCLRTATQAGLTVVSAPGA